MIRLILWQWCSMFKESIPVIEPSPLCYVENAGKNEAAVSIGEMRAGEVTVVGLVTGESLEIFLAAGNFSRDFFEGCSFILDM